MERGNAVASKLFSATTLVFRKRIFPISSPKKYGSGRWPYPPPWPSRKRHRALCGRLSGSGWWGIPQRSQRAQRSQRIDWKGGMQFHRSYFLQLPWSSENGFFQYPPPKSMDQGVGPIPPHGQVENVTAPSAGDSPGPDGEVGLRMRLPFRTAFSENGNTCNRDGADCRCCFAVNGRVWISRRGRSAPVVWMARR